MLVSEHAPQLIRPIGHRQHGAHRADTRFAPRTRAFTLLELVVVLAITAAITSIGLIKYSASLSRYRAQGAAARLVADLETARTQARHQSSPRLVRFAVDRTRYAILTPAQSAANATGLVTDLSLDPFHATFAITGISNNTLNFNGYGVADQSARITITSAGATAVVTIDADSGRAYAQP